ncbi:hypothetical protein M0P98_06790 [bacterium]|nr:hypothetical protein [bacterium]
MSKKKNSSVGVILLIIIILTALFFVIKSSVRQVSAETITPKKAGRMYLFVNFQEEDDYYNNGPSRGKIKARLEQASGERCLVIPYQQLNMSLVEEFKPLAIVMSGFPRLGKPEGYKGVAEVLEKSNIPMLCFCGSHQLIEGCLTYGYGKYGYGKPKRWRPLPIRRISPDEDFPRVARSKTSNISLYFVASGFFPIKRIKDDPIFNGLPELMVMKCAHFCEIKTLPADFDLLASSGHSEIAMIKHKSRTLYGTQFHPEAYSEPWLDGKILLDNFAIIVKKYWEEKK